MHGLGREIVSHSHSIVGLFGLYAAFFPGLVLQNSLEHRGMVSRTML